MICEQISSLIPAYALGNATGEETRIVEQHIASCRDHDADIAESRRVSGLLGHATEERKPSAELRDRIMAHARQNPGTQADFNTTGQSARLRRFRTGALRMNALAASLIVVIGVLIAWNVMLQTAEQPERFNHYYWGMDSDWLSLETELGKPGADIALGGIEPLDSEHRYQLWTTRGENILLVEAFNVNQEGRWSGHVEFTFLDGDRLWITAEPASGSPQPTGEAVLRTRF